MSGDDLLLTIRTFKHDEVTGRLTEEDSFRVANGSGWESVEELQHSRLTLASAEDSHLDCVALPDGVLIWERVTSAWGFRLVRSVTLTLEDP